MIQYINKQKNDFSCGPIALLNALKWRGEKRTYRNDYQSLVKLCNTDKFGTYDSDLFNALKASGFKFKTTQLYSQVVDHLKQGGSVILAHIDCSNDWHYSFWYEYRFNKFYGANIDTQKSIKFVREKTMRKYLLNSQDPEEAPYAILLS